MNIQLERLHNGLIKCPANLVIKLMPEVLPILETCPGFNDQSVVDVKVHMLMPNQYPCIPGWHCDLVPRDENNQQDFNKVDLMQNLWLWISGDPLPQFKDGRPVIAKTWIPFTQIDWHKGTMSTKHQWRMFIRVAPAILYKPNTESSAIRRHSQVYLDAEGFKW